MLVSLIARLNSHLGECIASEDYEMCASLRDDIAMLQMNLFGGTLYSDLGGVLRKWVSYHGTVDGFHSDEEGHIVAYVLDGIIWNFEIPEQEYVVLSLKHEYNPQRSGRFARGRK